MCLFIYLFLVQKANKIISQSSQWLEEQYPDDEVAQQNALAPISPPLPHGIIQTRTSKQGNDAAANVYLLQNFYRIPFQYFLVYLPDRDINVEAWTDLPEPINSPEKVVAMLVGRSKQFDQDLLRKWNMMTLVEVNQTKQEMLSQQQHDLLALDENALMQRILQGRTLCSVAEFRAARAALSNLLGGIGYWFGNQKWHLPSSQSWHFTPNMALFSAVPSRSFFPRGFDPSSFFY
ncbi:Mannosyl-oligosaccharide glucosidase [Reticulomyxa filosa]|uniref:mannosyl-oligosaccharide glucosidase n=1 Tax=Reticulomyxa filosa TaxID=46433 RepID=X6NHZ4_RETFI|nr:Mannosyl-oligosaccharide glucosidase [Reticulomyxa filosa]|eukprot:ETO25349.1 Mannosyl-oligosaccharide glucosidase [Reticulomyxa filosa]